MGSGLLSTNLRNLAKLGQVSKGWINLKAPTLMKTTQIGKCGELLVQYRMLMRGVESAHLTTDAGIDLVAYSSKMKEPVTVQVKTNLRAKPGGGKGKLALDWWVPEDSPAQCVALVDLSSEQIWLLRQKEVADLAPQRSRGRYHLNYALRRGPEEG